MVAQVPIPDPFGLFGALAASLGEAALIVLGVLAVLSIPHPAFVLSVNARRGGRFRTSPVLWGLAIGTSIVVILQQLVAGQLVAPLLYILWSTLYAPAGFIDALGRGALLAAGRRGTLRRHAMTRWAIDVLTVWPALIIGTISMAEGLILRGSATLPAVIGGIWFVALAAGRPIRRYRPSVDDDGPRGAAGIVWAISATATAGGIATLMPLVPSFVGGLRTTGLSFTNGNALTLGLVAFTLMAWVVSARTGTDHGP